MGEVQAFFSSLLEMRLIAIRHGETQWNIDGREQGHLDSALTPRGIQQSRAVAERLRRGRVSILYSSDLGRAMQTAEIISLIGEDDPVVPAEDRASFVHEMKQSGAEWQFHVFGDVGHSYTNREIDTRGMPGFAYNERADRRAWELMLSLFGEVL